MDEIVLRAVAKWPSVPSVYGWLSLDRRGAWRVRGERIHHRVTVAFINRNYAADEDGRWFFQNGPQRVYVALEYTPWIYSLDGTGRQFETHTGIPIAGIRAVWLDTSGSLLLDTPHGIGAVDDRALAVMSEALRTPDGGAVDEALVQRALDDPVSTGHPALVLEWNGIRHRVEMIAPDSVPERFGFVRAPADGTRVHATDSH